MKRTVRDYIRGLDSAIRDCFLFFEKGAIPADFSTSGLGRDYGIHFEYASEIDKDIERLRGNEVLLRRYLYSLILPFEANPILGYLDSLEFVVERPFAAVPPIAPKCCLPQKGVFKEASRILAEQDEGERDSTPAPSGNPRNIANTLSCCAGEVFMYANMIDGIMLEYGIDFAEIQEDCGIWLKPKGRMIDLDKRASDLQCFDEWNKTLAENSLRKLPRFKSEPSEAANTPKAPRKRTIPFESLIIENKERILKELHSLIDKRKGVKAIIIIYCAWEMGVISKPSSTQALEEFPHIGGNTLYNRYMNNPRAFHTKDLEATKGLLEKVLGVKNS
ncbi:MAG: hypothetical protein LIO90_08325 [Bacteroidales bacterium]|nr:hypothetical protein [Bacteroidales bacterium]